MYASYDHMGYPIHHEILLIASIINTSYASLLIWALTAFEKVTKQGLSRGLSTIAG